MSTTPQAQSPPGRSLSGARILQVLIPAALIIGALAAWLCYTEWHSIDEVNYTKEIGASLKMAYDGMLELDPSMHDANGDMIADPPAEAARLLDPDILIFAPLPSPEGETAKAWDDFREYLAKVTGKTVEYKDVNEPAELRKLLKEGRIHVLGVNTGGVPIAVNCGFVPMVVPAAADGSFGYHMELLVPAESPAQSPKDLKGKSIKFTAASSQSGYKTPLVVLHEEFRLDPGRDYKFSISGSHNESIKLIGKKECDAAPVASDLLNRAIAKGVIRPNQFRSIYASRKMPPGAYGVVYNLKPELSSKIREAFLTFTWKGTSLERSLGSSGYEKFVAVSYEDDWAYVRDVDARIISWAN